MYCIECLLSGTVLSIRETSVMKWKKTPAEELWNQGGFFLFNFHERQDFKNLTWHEIVTSLRKSKNYYKETKLLLTFFSPTLIYLTIVTALIRELLS